MVGADWHMMPSLVTSGELDFGSLGDADVLHGRVTVGYLLDRVELFTGYDHFDIGGVKIGSLMTGFRFRF